jgi:hypothetical protein
VPEVWSRGWEGLSSYRDIRVTELEETSSGRVVDRGVIAGVGGK